VEGIDVHCSPRGFQVELGAGLDSIGGEAAGIAEEMPVLRKLKCWLRLVVNAICTPRGENPAPKATLENGRGDVELMAGTGACSGATAS
jgi:hypothetical protein